MSQEIERVEPVSAAEYYGDERETFDRLHGESRREHQWAMHYFRLGKKRTFKEVAGYFEVGRQEIQLTAERHSWVTRSRAFDDYEESRRLADIEGAQLQTREKHMALLASMREKVEAKLSTLDVFAMSPRDLPAYVETLIKYERLTVGLGDAPKKIEITGKDGGAIQVADMPADERRQLMADIQAQIASRLKAIETAAEEDVIEGEIVDGDA